MLKTVFANMTIGKNLPTKLANLAGFLAIKTLKEFDYTCSVDVNRCIKLIFF